MSAIRASPRPRPASGLTSGDREESKDETIAGSCVRRFAGGWHVSDGRLGRRKGRHRRHRRHVRPLRRRGRRRRRRSGQDGDRRLRRLRPRPADRGAELRPPEQARPRRAEGARMGRPERPDDAAGRLQHRRQPGDERRDQGEEGSVLRHRRRRRVADRQGLHALHDPLRLRHRPRSPTARRRRSSTRAARAGSSSPPTTPSAPSCRTPRPTS